MPDMTSLTRLRDRLKTSRAYSGAADSIMERVQGKEAVRAGVPITMERAEKNLAPNGREYHIKIKASTGGIARDAGVIPLEAWRSGGLKNFDNNPVILAFHDHKEPIGISVHTALEGDSLVEYWLFHEHTETSRTMRKLYEEGFMRAASVGFIVQEWKFVDELNDQELESLVKQFGPTAVRDIFWIAQRAELLETSAVPVPSDPNALQFSAAKRSAEAVGLDISALTASRTVSEEKQMPAPADNTPTDQTAEVTRLAGVVTEQATTIKTLNETIVTLSATVEAVRAEIVALKGTLDARSDEQKDEVELEVEIRDGETEQQAVDRHIDEMLRSQTGAPVPTK